ncbi:MAG: hypothetical protein IJW63_11825 [Lachnospiraceae bacterium]|nr:hypothetical protein [Lachnospiraceae bacterium]
MKKTFIKLLCCALVLFTLSGVSVCAAEDLPPIEQGGIHDRPFAQE